MIWYVVYVCKVTFVSGNIRAILIITCQSTCYRLFSPNIHRKVKRNKNKGGRRSSLTKVVNACDGSSSITLATTSRLWRRYRCHSVCCYGEQVLTEHRWKLQMHRRQGGRWTRLTGEKNKSSFETDSHVACRLLLRRRPESRRPAPPAEPDYIWTECGSGLLVGEALRRLCTCGSKPPGFIFTFITWMNNFGDKITSIWISNKPRECTHLFKTLSRSASLLLILVVRKSRKTLHISKQAK